MVGEPDSSEQRFLRVHIHLTSFSNSFPEDLPLICLSPSLSYLFPAFLVQPKHSLLLPSMKRYYLFLPFPPFKFPALVQRTSLSCLLTKCDL